MFSIVVKLRNGERKKNKVNNLISVPVPDIFSIHIHDWYTCTHTHAHTLSHRKWQEKTATTGDDEVKEEEEDVCSNAVKWEKCSDCVMHAELYLVGSSATQPTRGTYPQHSTYFMFILCRYHRQRTKKNSFNWNNSRKHLQSFSRTRIDNIVISVVCVCVERLRMLRM